MGWSASTAIRMIKEVYGHVGLAARRRAMEQLEQFTSPQKTLRRGHKRGHNRTRNKTRGFSKVKKKNGSSGRTRTYNPPVNSRMLCH